MVWFFWGLVGEKEEKKYWDEIFFVSILIVLLGKNGESCRVVFGATYGLQICSSRKVCARTNSYASLPQSKFVKNCLQKNCLI